MFIFQLPYICGENPNSSATGTTGAVTFAMYAERLLASMANSKLTAMFAGRKKAPV